MKRKSLADRIRETGKQTGRKSREPGVNPSNQDGDAGQGDAGEHALETTVRAPAPQAVITKHAPPAGGAGEPGRAPDGQGPSIAGKSGRKEQAETLYQKAMDYVSGILSAVEGDEPFSAAAGVELAKKIVASLDQGEELFSLALHKSDGGSYLTAHAVNVAVYLARMTKALGYDRENRATTCAVGLLHDVGRARLPNGLLNKKGLFTDKERAIVQKSPEHSRRILSSMAPDYPLLAECAHQAYERLDGSGYPRGLMGGQINELAGLLGLADIYEALVHHRPHRRRFLHFPAAKEILKSGKKQFEPRLLKAFLEVFTVFPLHSYVRLNSGAVGRVEKTSASHPLRPVVKILYNSQGLRPVKEQVIDLSEEPLLFVVDSLASPDS
ncbi:MAG: HD domain-containing protein [Deltaproteobacteria bacterium]|nr:HD domain-containing protein [Deltaproteobacteria bacterium]